MMTSGNTDARVASRIDLNHELARMGVLLGIILVATGALCGPFWAKWGIFFHGLRSEREFWQWQQTHHASFLAAATRQTLDISLDADGRSSCRSRTYFHAASGRPMVYFQWARVPGPGTQLLDMQGRRLACRVISGSHGSTVWVHLARDTPAFLVETNEPGGRAERRGEGVWLYRMQHMFGPTIPYQQTVSLPPGAVVTRATPLPSRAEQRDERQVLEYEMVLEEAQAFEMSVEYRLADHGSAAGTPPGLSDGHAPAGGVP